MGSFLKVNNLCKHFGGLKAVDGVSFEMERNKIYGIIGPNGAGKSTLFNCISGFLEPTDGEVVYKDEKITGLKPFELPAKGLVRTFQENRFYPDLTVKENVFISYDRKYETGLFSELFYTKKYRAERKKYEEKTNELLEFVGLYEIKDEIASNLPHGSLRLLGIAIALAIEPEIILLDEPLTGMNRDEKDQILNLINKMNAENITVGLIEHDMKSVMNTCDRVIVLNYGCKIAEGTPKEVSNNKEVIDAYLGGEFKF